jgi:excinuclease ABC subunit A
LEQFDEVLLIDQEPLPQSRWSTPASYTGIIDSLKTLFSKTEEAKKAGLKKADFSYQSKQGKCPGCGGQGKLKTSMDFMSDLWLTCDRCQGMRYNDTVLACKFKGHSMGQVLQMTVQEAIEFFDAEVAVLPLRDNASHENTNDPKLHKKLVDTSLFLRVSNKMKTPDAETLIESLNILKRLGVGHLRLGQAGNTLSGGEAQRLKLAKSLLQKRKGTSLYLFDEPSTGLHYFDILPLIAVFQSIIASGDTVLFIEHNHTLIGAADRVITLGPGSGVMGGEVV